MEWQKTWILLFNSGIPVRRKFKSTQEMWWMVRIFYFFVVIVVTVVAIVAVVEILNIYLFRIFFLWPVESVPVQRLTLWINFNNWIIHNFNCNFIVIIIDLLPVRLPEIWPRKKYATPIHCSRESINVTIYPTSTDTSNNDNKLITSVERRELERWHPRDWPVQDQSTPIASIFSTKH